MATPSSIRALELARAHLDEQLAQKPDDPKLLVLRARADERLEQFDAAADFYRRAADRYHALNDVAAEATARLDAGNMLIRAGSPGGSWGQFEGAIRLFLQAGDPLGAARARCGLARGKIEGRHASEAYLLLEASVPPLTQHEDWELLGWVHEQLAQLMRESGDREGALREAKAAVECAAKGKDRRRFGRRLAAVAALHRELGNRAKARQYQEKAQPHLLGADDVMGALAGYELLADVLPDTDAGAAIALIDKAISYADVVGKPGYQGRLRARRAKLEADAGRLVPARDLLVRAVAMLQVAGDPRASAPAFVLLARVHWLVGERNHAVAALDRAESLHRMLGDDTSAENVAHMRNEAVSGEWTP
jgi:tetratricopeptide (TPR) repeat protein